MKGSSRNADKLYLDKAMTQLLNFRDSFFDHFWWTTVKVTMGRKEIRSSLFLHRSKCVSSYKVANFKPQNGLN